MPVVELPADDWVRVRLFCRCMEAPRMCEERSWHRQEVEVLTTEEAREMIEQHQCEGSEP